MQKINLVGSRSVSEVFHSTGEDSVAASLSSESILVCGPASWSPWQQMTVVTNPNCGEHFSVDAVRQAVLVSDSDGHEMIAKLFLSSNQVACDDFKRECDAMRQLGLFASSKPSPALELLTTRSTIYPLKIIQVGKVTIRRIDYHCILMERFKSDMNNDFARQMLLKYPDCCQRFLHQTLIQLKIMFSKERCHHDIKPDNICISSHDPATASFVIIDFGHTRKPDNVFSSRGNPHPAGTHGYRSIDLLAGTATCRGDVESLVITTLIILGCTLDETEKPSINDTLESFEAHKKLLGVRYCQRAKVPAQVGNDMAASYLAAFRFHPGHPGFFAHSILHKLLVGVFTTDALTPMQLDRFIEMTRVTANPFQNPCPEPKLQSILSTSRQQVQQKSHHADDIDVNALMTASKISSKVAHRQFTAVSASKRTIICDPKVEARAIFSETATRYEDHFLWNLLQRYQQFGLGSHAIEDVVTALQYFESCIKVHSGVTTRDEILLSQVWKMSLITDNIHEYGIEYDCAEKYEFTYGMVEDKSRKLKVSVFLLDSVRNFITCSDMTAFSQKSYDCDPSTVAPIRCNPPTLFDMYLRALFAHTADLRNSKPTNIYALKDSLNQPFLMSLPDMEYVLYFFFLMQFCKLAQRALDFSDTGLVIASNPEGIWRDLGNVHLVGENIAITTNTVLKLLPAQADVNICAQTFIDFARIELPVPSDFISYALTAMQAQIACDQDIMLICPNLLQQLIKREEDPKALSLQLAKRQELLDFIFGSNDQRDQLMRKTHRLILGVLYDGNEDMKQSSFSIFAVQYRHNSFGSIDDPLFLFGPCTSGTKLSPALLSLKDACCDVQHWLGRVIKQAIAGAGLFARIKEGHNLTMPAADSVQSAALSLLCVHHLVTQFDSTSQEPVSCSDMIVLDALGSRKRVLEILFNSKSSVDQSQLADDVRITSVYAQLCDSAAPYFTSHANSFDPLTKQLEASKLSITYFTRVRSSWSDFVAPDYANFLEFHSSSYGTGRFQIFSIAEIACKRLNTTLSAYRREDVFCLNLSQQSKILQMHEDDRSLKQAFNAILSKQGYGVLQHLQKANFIFTPMFDGRDHWVLVVLDKSEKKVIVVDSIQGDSTHTLLAKIQRLVQKLKICGILDDDWRLPLNSHKFQVLPQISNCCLFLALTVMEAACVLSILHGKNCVTRIRSLLSTNIRMAKGMDHEVVAAALRLFFLVADAQPQRLTAADSMRAIDVYSGFTAILDDMTMPGYDFSAARIRLLDNKMYTDKKVWEAIWRTDNQNSEYDVAEMVKNCKSFVDVDVDLRAKDRAQKMYPTSEFKYSLDESLPETVGSVRQDDEKQLSDHSNDSAEDDEVIKGNCLDYSNHNDSEKPPETLPDHLQWIRADSEHLQYVLDVDAVRIAAKSLAQLLNSFANSCQIEIFEKSRRPSFTRSLRLNVTFGINLSECAIVQFAQFTGISDCPMELLVLQPKSQGLAGSASSQIDHALNSFWADKRVIDLYRERRRSSRQVLEQVEACLARCFTECVTDDVIFAAHMVGSKDNIRITDPVQFPQLYSSFHELHKKLNEHGINSEHLETSSPEQINYSYDFGMSIRHSDERISVNFPRFKCVRLWHTSGSRSDSVKDCLAHKDFIASFHSIAIVSNDRLLQNVSGLKVYNTAENEIVARQLKKSIFDMPNYVMEACLIPSDGSRKRALESIEELFHDGEHLVRCASNVSRSWTRIEVSSKTVEDAYKLTRELLEMEEDTSLIVSPNALLWKAQFARLLNKTLLLLVTLAKRLMSEFPTATYTDEIDFSSQESKERIDIDSAPSVHLKNRKRLESGDLHFAELLQQELDPTDWVHVAYFKSLFRFLVQGLTESLPRYGASVSALMRSHSPDIKQSWFLQLPSLRYFVSEIVPCLHSEADDVNSAFISEKLLSQALLWQSYAKVTDADVDRKHKTIAFHIRFLYDSARLITGQSGMQQLWERVAWYFVSCTWWNLLHDGLVISASDMRALKQKRLSLTSSNLSKYSASMKRFPVTIIPEKEGRETLWLPYLKSVFICRNAEDATHFSVLVRILTMLTGMSNIDAVANLYEAFDAHHIADVFPQLSRDPNKIFERQNHFVKLGQLQGFVADKIRMSLGSPRRAMDNPHTPRELTMKEHFRHLIDKLKAQFEGNKIMHEAILRAFDTISQSPKHANTSSKRARNTIEFKTRFYDSVVQAFSTASTLTTWPDTACSWFLLTDYIQTMENNSGNDAKSEIVQNNRTTSKLHDLVVQQKGLSKLRSEIEAHMHSVSAVVSTPGFTASMISSQESVGREAAALTARVLNTPQLEADENYSAPAADTESHQASIHPEGGFDEGPVSQHTPVTEQVDITQPLNRTDPTGFSTLTVLTRSSMNPSSQIALFGSRTNSQPTTDAAVQRVSVQRDQDCNPHSPQRVLSSTRGPQISENPKNATNMAPASKFPNFESKSISGPEKQAMNRPIAPNRPARIRRSPTSRESQRDVGERSSISKEESSEGERSSQVFATPSARFASLPPASQPQLIPQPPHLLAAAATISASEYKILLDRVSIVETKLGEVLDIVKTVQTAMFSSNPTRATLSERVSHATPVTAKTTHTRTELAASQVTSNQSTQAAASEGSQKSLHSDAEPAQTAESIASFSELDDAKSASNETTSTRWRSILNIVDPIIDGTDAGSVSSSFVKYILGNMEEQTSSPTSDDSQDLEGCYADPEMSAKLQAYIDEECASQVSRTIHTCHPFARAESD